MTELVFYDIPGKSPEGKAWSPNTWIIRYSLNYKGLKYRTEWVEYPDIEAVCKKIGASPTGVKDDGSPHYTLPVIYDPSTKSVVSDSIVIADYLDKTYPDTPLFPPGTRRLHAAFLTALGRAVVGPLFNIVVLATCLSLNPPSYEYFRRTREEKLGKLEEITPEGEAGEYRWKELEAGLSTVAGWFKADGDRPFVGGDTIYYADLLIAARLVWAKNTLGEASEGWQRIKSLDGGRWGRYFQRFDKYSTIV